MCLVHKIGMALLLIGGLNWGLIALGKYNLVDSLLGAGSDAARLVYGLVGISALLALMMGKCCMKCGSCPNCGKTGCGCK